MSVLPLGKDHLYLLRLRQTIEEIIHFLMPVATHHPNYLLAFQVYYGRVIHRPFFTENSSRPRMRAAIGF
jgi:hypothetical protein